MNIDVKIPNQLQQIKYRSIDKIKYSWIWLISGEYKLGSKCGNQNNSLHQYKRKALSMIQSKYDKNMIKIQIISNKILK